MGLFGKLKEILFDEETVEIPVITKEEKRAEKEKKREKDREERPCEDEVKIEKIETPPKRKPVVIEDDEEDLFDMPKLKEEKEVEVQTKTFTFPVFEDEEVAPKEEKTKRRTREIKEEEPVRAPKEKRVSGYTNAYDYSYGKYKGDYKTSREENASRLSKVLDKKEERKAFTPSPIISPVYGVLNENYKKEDIVSKSEKKKSGSQVLDLDSVRRKAYGTLEDEIEVSLTQNDDYVEEDVIIDDYDVMEDEGISIDDLLVDRDITPEDELREFMSNIEDDDTEEDDTELFDPEEVKEEIPDEIDLDDELEGNVGEPTSEIEDEPEIIIEEEIDVDMRDEEEEEEKPRIKVEKTEDKKEVIGEEDLFDLIDSLYEGKGEE